MKILRHLPKNMHELKTVWLHYTSPGKVFGRSSKSEPRSLIPLVPSNLYHRCNELPLSIFITCTCDKNYSGLVKHGKAKDSDINRAWELIYSEYTDISGNPTSKHLISLSKEISWQESKLSSVSLCLKVLQYVPDQRCINVLKGYGYDYRFDITNPEQYSKDLETVAIRLGSVIFTIQQKSVELEKDKKKISSKPMTRESFDDILAVLFEHFKSQIDPRKTTVSEYVSYRRRYEQVMESIERTNSKNKASGTNLNNL